jgi:hypothetical protein
MNTPEQTELLIEAVTSAHRDHTGEGVSFSPAWFDLDAEGRQAAFEIARLQRRLEAALDPRGCSTTARAVLARIAGG